VNPATLKDSHSVTLARASRAGHLPAYDDYLAAAQVASFPSDTRCACCDAVSTQAEGRKDYQGLSPRSSRAKPAIRLKSFS
jgi:hypothetical protein